MNMTGTPWLWGYNACAQLVSGLNNVIVIVADGDSHILTLLPGGTIRAWSIDYGC